tara:strand:+ start:701 stop:1036 length:336 start_codon:yes stop_codon:yes gene_type:complete
MRLCSVRFRHTNGNVELVMPKGSHLLQVHQSGSGYWFADLMAPDTTDEEPLRLFIATMRDTTAQIDAGWECVGHTTTHAGTRAYVFYDRPKRKPGRPKKAAKTPPVDADPA